MLYINLYIQNNIGVYQLDERNGISIGGYNFYKNSLSKATIYIIYWYESLVKYGDISRVIQKFLRL